MRLVNDGGRLSVLRPDGLLDVERASEGLFGPDPQGVYERWDEFRAWVAGSASGEGTTAGGATTAGALRPLSDPRGWGPPVPRPRQVFAFGLNYRDHAAESGFAAPTDLPPVFTKFVSAITGPVTTVVLPEGHVDWEVELAVVIAHETREIGPEEAWDAVAGVTVAQDLSERVRQLAGPAPQFSLAKSHPGFLPLGPVLVTPEELADRDALELTSAVDGEIVQRGSTRDLISPVPALIAGLSAVVTLLPGDLILTGTPAGVGVGRTPQRFLRPGEVLTSTIEGIGSLEQTFVARDGGR